MAPLKKEVQSYIECCEALLDVGAAFTEEEQQFLLYYAQEITKAAHTQHVPFGGTVAFREKSA